MDTKIAEEHVYYVRPCPGCAPVATVAISCRDGVYSRGIGICGLDEQFQRRSGRRLAIARMDRAMGTRQSSLPIGLPIPAKGRRFSGMELQDHWNREFGADIEYKSGYDVMPTEFEQYMFSKGGRSAK